MMHRDPRSIVLSFCLSAAVATMGQDMAALFLQPGFVENVGQLHYPDGTPASDVLYKWQGPDFNMLFMRDRFVYEIQYVEKEAMEEYQRSMERKAPTPLTCGSQRIEYVFVGSGMLRIMPQDRLQSRTIYPGGDGKGTYRPNAYGRLIYQNVFPSVDIEFNLDAAGHCEYDIVLHEGARLSDVGFDLKGIDAQQLRLDGDKASTEFSFGIFRERIPAAYAQAGAHKHGRTVQYERGPGGRLTLACGGNVDRVPAGEQFVIDPIGAIDWGTYFCPAGSSKAARIVAQGDDVFYATGNCFSGSLVLGYDPLEGYSGTGALDLYGDVWVAKFQDIDGTLQNSDLLWWTLVGGADAEDVLDMDVCNNKVAICGWTESSLAEGFPANGADIYPTGMNPLDGYLVFLDGSSGTPTYVTYIGGAYDDFAASVAFDCRPEVTSTTCYVATECREWPIDEVGTLQTDPGTHPFQYSPYCWTGSRYTILQQYGDYEPHWTTCYSTQCVPYGWVAPEDLAVDHDGNAILVTRTLEADNADLGTTFNSYIGGLEDYVVSSFAPDASLNWARWFGTDYDDKLPNHDTNGAGLAIGSGDAIYVAGTYTSATETKAYCSKIENSTTPNDLWSAPAVIGDGLTCTTVLAEISQACSGKIIAVGQTDCSGGTLGGFTTAGSHDEVYGGSKDGYIAEIVDMGTSGSITYTSYYGGSGLDWISDVHAKDKGNVYICGDSYTPLPGAGGSGIAFNGNGDWINSGAGGQTAFMSRFPHECCPAEYVIPDGAVSSTYGSGLTGTTIYVEGTWTIDNNFTLTNCTVYAATGSQIIVGTGSGVVLTLDNTHILACEDMWVGLRTQYSTSGIWMQSSSISDAQFGVDLVDGTNLTAYDSEFTNNYIGIRIPPPVTPGAWNAVGLKLRNCLLATIGGGLKAPFPGQLPAPGDIGYAGVYANRTNIDLSSDLGYGDNVFKNLNYGIWAKDVGFTVQRDRFESIHVDPAYGGLTEDGAAILCRGYGSFLSLNQIGKGTNSGDPTTFLNCKWGIWAERMNITSHDNKMAGSGTLTGYHVRYCGGRSVDIVDNDLDVQWTGVDLRFNDGATSLQVHKNQILFGLNPGTGLAKGTAAISVNDMNGTNAASSIYENDITFRPLSTSAATGISLTSASWYTVRDNNVEMTFQPNNRYGINVVGSTRNTVSCNNITGQILWAGNWSLSPTDQAGLRQSLGNNNRFACNSATLTRQGFIFNGSANPTDLRGTNFGAHDIGLLLTTGALIGPQLVKGNVWYGPSITWGAQWMGASALTATANRFRVNDVMNPLCMPGSWAPTQWFLSWPDPNFECTSGVPVCPTPMLQSSGERSQTLDEAVMQGIVDNGIYTEETRLTLAYELYTAMTEDPSLYDGGAYTADFLTIMENSVAEALMNVEQPRKELYDMPGSVLTQVQQNEADISALMEQIRLAQDQLSDPGLTPAQIGAIQANVLAWQQNVNDLTNWNATANANLDAVREVDAQALKSETGLITSTELIEQNAKAVNDIYFGTIGKSGELAVFDAGQASTLYEIADQCPLLGGDPVYQARALYALIDDQAQFDDALLCSASGFVVKTDEQDASEVTVYPNPARTGLITVELSELGAGEHSATLELFDAQGQRVLRKGISDARAHVDVSSLAQGLYSWTLLVDGIPAHHGKITIL